MKSQKQLQQEEIKRFKNSRKIRIQAMNPCAPVSPPGVYLTARAIGEAGNFQELELKVISHTEQVMADIIFGIDDVGELRLLITQPGSDDPRLAIYPERKTNVVVYFK